MRLTDVTAVIAAKDEEATVAEVVSGCLPQVAEVLVVDGHSRDATAERARTAGARVIQDGGRGKGEALRRAIAELRTDIVVFLDADGSHDPADIPRLVQPIHDGTADHVSGSRLIGGSSELHGGFDEFLRLTGSSLITACINRRFHVRLSESQNGYRALRVSTLRQLRLTENSTTIEQEMIIKTLRAGHRLVEVPAHEHRRRVGVSHIRVWRAAPRYLYSLLKHLLH